MPANAEPSGRCGGRFPGHLPRASAQAPALGPGRTAGTVAAPRGQRTAVKARVRAARLTSRECAAAVPEAAPVVDEPMANSARCWTRRSAACPRSTGCPSCSATWKDLTTSRPPTASVVARDDSLPPIPGREQLRRRLSRRGLDPARHSARSAFPSRPPWLSPSFAALSSATAPFPLRS